MFLALTSVNFDGNCRSYRNTYAWVEGWNDNDDVIFGQPLSITYVKIKEQLFLSTSDKWRTSTHECDNEMSTDQKEVMQTFLKD
jgi:hypothetical protein